METTIRRPLLRVLLSAALGLAIPAMAAMIQPSNHPDVYVRAAEDTNNIEAALNGAAAAGASAVVELAQGTFYVSRPIAVRDFDGTFKGQGMGVTTVRTIGDDAFPVHRPPLPPLPRMMDFYYVERAANPAQPANLAITDMTLHFAGLTVPYAAGFPAFSRLGYVLGIDGRMSVEPVAGDPSQEGPSGAAAYLDLALSRVEVAGMAPDLAFVGVTVASWIPWRMASSPLGPYVEWRISEVLRTHGAIGITDSSFHNMRFGFDTYGYSDSTIRLERLQGRQMRNFSLLESPRATDIVMDGLDLQDVRLATRAFELKDCSLQLSGSRIAFARNNVHVAAWIDGGSGSHVSLAGLDLVNGSALAVFERHGAAPNTYRVFDNTILRAPNSGWGAVEAHSAPTGIAGQSSPRISVEHNHVGSQGFIAIWAPVWAEAIDHLTVSNNTFDGAAGAMATIPAAIFVRGADACRLVNNDVRAFRTPGPQYYLEDVNDCLIAAGASAGGVAEGQVAINGGTNNRVVGVTPTGFTGPATDRAAASEMKRAMLQSMNDD